MQQYKAVKNGVKHQNGTADSHLYRKVAGQIQEAIERGALQAGQKVPSVRRLSAQQSVSVSTVLQAYGVLEDTGWIEARPQSGYYVRHRLTPAARENPAPPEPAASQPSLDATSVNICDLAAQVMKAGGKPGLLNLSVALPGAELLPMRQLNQAMMSLMRRFPHISATYDVPPGCEALRIALARRSLEMGCQLTPDDILITSGATEALNLCLRAVTKPGDTIALESPTYYGVLQIIESLGLKALELPTHPRDGLSVSALEYALDSQPIQACFVMPCLNNPLGSSMPEASKQRMVELLAERGVPLIEDDSYGDLFFGPQRPRAAKSYDRTGNVLLCSSFSKTLAPGYRVGWVAPGRYAHDVEHFKLIGSVATTSLEPLTIAEFLSTGGYDRYLRRARRQYADQLTAMTQAIACYFPSGTCVTRPQGGFLLWVEIPPTGPGIQQSLDLFTAATREGVGLAPGPLFTARGKYGNCIRLNCSLPWSSEVEKAVQILGRLAS